MLDSFEWEVFKRTGSIEHFLLMKQREQEHQTFLEEYGTLENDDEIDAPE